MAIKKLPTRTPDEQKEANQFVSSARTKVDAWLRSTVELRQQIEEDFRFSRGGRDQWDAKDAAKLDAEERPVQSFNVTGAVVNFLAGYQLETDKDYRTFPRGTEDEQLGRLMSAQIKYAQDIGDNGAEHHNLFRKGITGGMSVVEVAHSFDYTDDLLEGDILQTVLEANSWGHEIGARRYDRNDAAYQFKLMWYTPEDGERQWPQHALAFQTANKPDWLTADPIMTGVPEQLLRELHDKETGRVRVMQYWYRVPVTVTLLVNTATGDIQRMESDQAAEDYIRTTYDTAGRQAASNYQIAQASSQSALIHAPTGRVFPFMREDQAAQALDLIRRQAGSAAIEAFDLVTRPTTALRVAHLTGWELLDDGPSPYGSDWRYPFVPFFAYQDSDDFRSIKGVVRDLKDAQREINWHHATMLDAIIRGPKGGVWVQKGDNVDIQKLKREISRSGFIGEYAGNQPPVPVVPAALNPADMAMLEFGIDIIMRISGVNAELMGQTTQKTVSGRAIQSRQSGGLVGVGSLFANWKRTKKLIGELLLRRIQQYYSVEKMDRIIGQNQRMAQAAGLFQMGVIPDQQMYASFKRLKQIDMDVVVDFQDASPTARSAVFTRMMQMTAAGFPIPPQMILEASDVPYTQEIQAALAKQGMQPPNPELAKAISAGQGSAPQPNGVNAP